MSLRPTLDSGRFSPVGIGGMDLFPDGRLAIVSWGGFKRSEGKVYVLKGVEGNHTENIQVTELAQGLREPMGLKVVNNEIYVVEKTGLVKITDNDSDGVGKVDTVYNGWGFDESFDVKQGTWHAYGLEFVNDYFYITLSNDRVFWAGVLGQGAEDRGTLIRIPYDGKGRHEILAGGLRNPNGLGIGPDGQFFATDNQGQWLPSNKLIHLVPGRFYGFRMNPKSPFIEKETSPPTAWVPQDEVGNSPSEPIMLEKGPFAGQLLIGDVHMGGIKRYFLERIKGEYQACIFRFSDSDTKNGIEAGVNRLVLGSDGSIYVGGVGGGDAVGLGGWSDWNWNLTTTGLQKLTPTGKMPFEMVAIRSLDNGFEIEFSKPVGRSAKKRGTYKLEQWGYAPSKHYGAGNKVGLKKLKVSNVHISDDNKKVHLEMRNFKENQTIHFYLRGLQSDGGEGLWSEHAWYYLTRKGPADVMGCMNENYAEFHPAAEYDFGKACQTPLSPAEKESRLSSAQTLAPKFKIHKSSQGKVKIDVPFKQAFKVTILDLDGKDLAAFSGQGPVSLKPDLILGAGVYTIKARVGIATFSRRVQIP